MHRVLAALGTAIALGMVVALMVSDAATGSPGTSQAATAAAVSPAGTLRTGSVLRFNVGATHSPQLERMLAGQVAVAPMAASAGPAALPAGASAVQGIDVASYQHANGPITWSKVAGAGYKFAFIKVTEGSYYINPYYASDAAGAQAAGMFAAPYAFAIPNYSGGALQADYALDHANYAPDGRLLPPILDIEYDPYVSQDGTNTCYGLSPVQMVAWISAFVTEVQRRTGQHPVIYSTTGWWDQCTGDSTAFSADPLWIADPATSPPASLPSGWNSWAYWQYSQSATVPGIVDSTTDASYLSSTALELAAPANQSNGAGSQVSLQANGLYAGLASGYTGPALTYSATGLPTGTQIDATGAVSGTLPATPTTSSVVITASVSGDPNAAQQFSWYVHGSVSLGWLARQRTSVGAPVDYQIPASDGLPGCTLRFSTSPLPPGLAVSSCGTISGWPTTAGYYRVIVRVTDSSGALLRRGVSVWVVRAADGSGPAGHIVLRLDGKCLTDRNPADIATEPCSRSAAQRWTVAADGSLRISGLCLAAKYASGTAAAALRLRYCGTDPQRWQLGTNAVLMKVGSDRCLSDTGRWNGSLAVAAVCKLGSSQQWTLPAGPLTSGIAGYCASTVGAARDPAGVVTLRPCNSTAQQSWTVEPDGALRIGSTCVGTSGRSLTPGTELRLVLCRVGNVSEHWQLYGGPIGVQLLSPAAGLCVADPGDRAKSGMLLRLGPCVAGDPGTRWRVS